MRKLSIAFISRVLWALVLVTLPVTSFRFMPFLGSGTYVRPLAIYPLALLLPLLLIRLKRKEIARPWPGVLTILIAFLFACLAATAYGAMQDPIELRGVDFIDRALRAVVTLLIGLSFFVAAVWMNQDESDVRFSIRWLLIGLAAHLLWGAVQFVGLNNGYRKQLLEIQNLFSIRGLVKNKRISGFAYEPSWLAGQIATLYLPWLTASLLMRYRAWSRATPETQKRGWIDTLQATIEPILLVGAAVGLLMTYSRSGLAIAFLAGIVTFALAGKTAFVSFWNWMRAGFDWRRTDNASGIVRSASSRVVLIFFVMSVMIGVYFFLLDKGYIAAFFKSQETDLVSYAQDVYLGPRLAYATAALASFEQHPMTGVGLGASGFTMFQNMPDWILAGEPEISRQMSPKSNLYPNPKNLYVRLLAETGLPGFMLFLVFYLALFAEAFELLRYNLHNSNGSSAAGWLAAAGIFSLTAVIFQGASQDSFAMPEMWINLGILAGASGAFTAYKLKKQDLT